MTMVTIEVQQEQLSAIVKADLLDMLDCLTKDLERVKENKKGSVFSMDYDEDRKELKKHIKSFKRVLRYYGELL